MSWDFCVNICMNGAISMLGERKRFASFLLEQNHSKSLHDTQRGINGKNLSENLKNAMNDVKIVNCVKSSALRSKIFERLCETMDSEFKCLLYHTEVRWLSKGKVLSRFITLKEEIQIFFNSQQTKFKVFEKDLFGGRK